MIYLDSSVALAHLLAETMHAGNHFGSSRRSRAASWNMKCGIECRRGLGRSHGEAVRALTARVALIEMTPPVLARALEPFAVAARTLDALHLASMEFIRSRLQAIALARLGARLLAGARAQGIPIYQI